MFIVSVNYSFFMYHIKSIYSIFCTFDENIMLWIIIYIITSNIQTGLKCFGSLAVVDMVDIDVFWSSSQIFPPHGVTWVQQHTNEIVPRQFKSLNRLSNSMKIDLESALVIFKEAKCLNTISFSIAEKKLQQFSHCLCLLTCLSWNKTEIH